MTGERADIKDQSTRLEIKDKKYKIRDERSNYKIRDQRSNYKIEYQFSDRDVFRTVGCMQQGVWGCVSNLSYMAIANIKYGCYIVPLKKAFRFRGR